MHILGSSKNFSWVISPLRELFIGNRVKQRISEYAATNNMPLLSIVEQKYVAFSRVEGQDLGMTIQSVTEHENYIYLEWRAEGCVFVHIQNGELEEDRVIKDASAVISALKLISEKRHRMKISAYVIDTYNANNEPTVISQIDALTGDDGSVVSLGSSLLDTVGFDSAFSFLPMSEAERDLRDGKTQTITMASALFVAVIIAVSIFWDRTEMTERYVLTDDYQEYTNTVLSAQSASVLLAQDFNMHQLLKRELNSWILYKVTYAPKGLTYSIVMDPVYSPTLQQLHEFAELNNLEVIYNSEGMHLFSPAISVSPYKQPEEVRMFNMPELIANIVDNANQMTPYISFRIERLQRQPGVNWGTRALNATFKQAADHDLVRLAAVFDGFPIRYPVIIQDQSSYQVTDNGQFTNGLKFYVLGGINE